MKTPEDILEENGYSIDELEESETMLFRNPDFSGAIVGIDNDNRVIYDYNKMIEFLVETEDMDYDEAADYICYDTLRALNYIPGNKPIVMFSFMD